MGKQSQYVSVLVLFSILLLAPAVGMQNAFADHTGPVGGTESDSGVVPELYDGAGFNGPATEENDWKGNPKCQRGF